MLFTVSTKQRDFRRLGRFPIRSPKPLLNVSIVTGFDFTGLLWKSYPIPKALSPESNGVNGVIDISVNVLC